MYATVYLPKGILLKGVDINGLILLMEFWFMMKKKIGTILTVLVFCGISINVSKLISLIVREKQFVMK